MKKYLCALALFFNFFAFADESKFVILICSYNNSKWVKNNIRSALNQNYSNYRIIYINDASKDDTLMQLKDAIKGHPKENIVEIIDNKFNQGALANIYNVIHTCIEDLEIVCTLDGDDMLANNEVLSILDKIYSYGKNKIWLTYGQYMYVPPKEKGHCSKYKLNKSFREQGFLASHLKTFYSWLFKKIKIEDLKYEGKFLDVAGDVAFMMPMLEMARYHHLFIPKILYQYNCTNPISDFRIKTERQNFFSNYILKKEPYQAL
jgi:glycosyltransferase involved in cell wall biosynthesis